MSTGGMTSPTPSTATADTATADTATAEATRAPIRFNPFGAEFRRSPYPLYARLRGAQPVHRTLGMWVLTRHADVRGVLHDRTFSAGLIPQLVSRQASRLSRDDVARIGRLATKSLVFTDNPDHARLRGLVNRVFTAQAVAELRPRVHEVAERLVRRAWDDGGMDVVADLAGPLPLTVMCDWMALPDSLRERVGPWTHDIRFLLEPGLMKTEDFTRVSDVVETFAQALDDVVTERRSRPGDDLISRLLAARTAGGDRLSDEEVVFVCIMCFVAGNETTKSLIGNGLLALLQHPDQDARLRRRPELLGGAVDEALRYDSPLQLTKRVATREVEIDGSRIRAGDQVLLCLGAANRDPAVFSRPDEFDITRDARGHLAFGHGMHGCLGGILAQLQAQVALDRLYRRAERLELLVTQPDWQDHSFIVRGLKQLPVSVRGVG
ncbi:cytochrome P450 [Frankia casuarinae]|uniref:Cytochrome P450 n=2 Tax=Frankiaceae TaxID=74712 RepID=Q2JCL2_FRACC|nr:MULTISPECIES: cytochrome P450 [unclassified Frankia]ABD10980.1 cytochrome P450 [Frankia casuarinae]KDA42851.1 cytochrome P450 [Frankia sp. BMG5.23]KEZ37502.1 cytochrome P450 [Frankia sp. CeD]ETA02168.1 cytochrome P450 [Frankia sp. CcI6]EYT92334.1 cytochrome P450 [Frankia casuarinae]